MRQFEVVIRVFNKANVPDPILKPTEAKIRRAGFAMTVNRVGSCFLITAEAWTDKMVERKVKKLCQEILANPVYQEAHVVSITQTRAGLANYR